MHACTYISITHVCFLPIPECPSSFSSNSISSPVRSSSDSLLCADWFPHDNDISETRPSSDPPCDRQTSPGL